MGEVREHEAAAYRRKSLQNARIRLEQRLGVIWCAISVDQLRAVSVEDDLESEVIRIRLTRADRKRKRRTNNPVPNEQLAANSVCLEQSEHFAPPRDDGNEVGCVLSASWAYYGSAAQYTRKLLAYLERCGNNGMLAAALFRAQKSSTRAKSYRGKFRGLAYDRKSEVLEEICWHLLNDTSSHNWGWGIDNNAYFKDVLYVDLPTGQVSFHSSIRYAGPDYDGTWDSTQDSENNVIAYCDQVIESVPAEPKAKVNRQRKPKSSFQCSQCGSTKLTSLTHPRGWLLFSFADNRFLVCSDNCKDKLVTTKGSDYFPPDWIFPRGRHTGIALGSADADYLKFLVSKLNRETNELWQAAKVELTRRAAQVERIQVS